MKLTQLDKWISKKQEYNNCYLKWQKQRFIRSATGFSARSPVFCLYINDFSNKVESLLRLYANDVDLYGEIYSEKDVIRFIERLDVFLLVGSNMTNKRQSVNI